MGYSVSLATGSLIIGIIAMCYVAAGGLKACAWADLIQGSALILGGAVVMYFAFQKLGAATEAARVVDVGTGAVTIEKLKEGTGALSRFWELNSNRMNMFLPKDDTILPWTALLLGLWIPNFYYWGLNQYITQRTLGSASLAQGQQGIVFAAFMKLLIPFVIVIPGIIAFNLFAKEMRLGGVADNAKVVAKYVKANPQTKMVEVLREPTAEQIGSWPEGRYMLALFRDEEALSSVRTENPFILPFLAFDFDEVEVPEYAVFSSEDYAWKHVNEGLAIEIDAYNGKTELAAKAAGESVSKEKLIAYKYDTALGHLLGSVLPQKVGLLGFVLAALLGAVVSSLAAMLNAASTIFTMDVFKKYVKPTASQATIVLLGRICVVGFTAIAIFLAPQLGNPKISNSIFTIIQESQGFISPGILAVFVFGLLVRRGPPVTGVIGLLTNIAAYGALKLAVPKIQFLNRMAICFGLCLAVMAVITVIKPLAKPVEFKQQTDIQLSSSRGALLAGILVVVLTLVLYVLFSPIGLV
jgi:SSS family solute:Na+ symporter